MGSRERWISGIAVTCVGICLAFALACGSGGGGNGNGEEQLTDWWNHALYVSTEAGYSGWAWMLTRSSEETYEVLSYGNSDPSESQPDSGDVQTAVSSDGIITSLPGGEVVGFVNLDEDITVMTITNSYGGSELWVGLEKATSYSSSELVGTWTVHTLVAGANAGFQGWGRGTLTVDSNGSFSTLEFTKSDGDTSGQTGSVSITAGGLVTFLGTGPPATSHGAMSTDKNLIAMTMTDGGGGYSLIMMVRQQGSYSVSDLAGDWRIQMLYCGTGCSWQRGTGTVESDGDYSATTVDGQGNQHNDSGTLSISASGITSVAGPSLFEGIMSPDKNLMVATHTSGTGDNYALGVWLKAP